MIKLNVITHVSIMLVSDADTYSIEIDSISEVWEISFANLI